jgi:hypothetical protein
LISFDGSNDDTYRLFKTDLERFKGKRVFQLGLNGVQAMLDVGAGQNFISGVARFADKNEIDRIVQQCDQIEAFFFCDP